MHSTLSAFTGRSEGFFQVGTKHRNHNMSAPILSLGPNGHGPIDFAIDLLQTAKTVGVTEVLYGMLA
ncbi:unnamed protein product [Rhizophagus irregularis]|nr:unnamed protein product [Rhizophagus irregularis]